MTEGEIMVRNETAGTHHRPHKKLVSVVIPCSNEEKNIDKANILIFDNPSLFPKI